MRSALFFLFSSSKIHEKRKATIIRDTDALSVCFKTLVVNIQNRIVYEYIFIHNWRWTSIPS